MLVGRGRAGRLAALCALNLALRRLRFESVEDQSKHVSLDLGLGAEFVGLRLEVEEAVGLNCSAGLPPFLCRP